MKALFLIASLIAFSAVAGAADTPTNPKPETICKNTKMFKNFIVVVQVTPQDDNTLQATVRRQHVTGLKFGKVTSFELMKPQTVAKTEAGQTREYKGDDFDLSVPMATTTDTHDGNLEMTINGKKTKMDVTCVDQG